MAFYHKIPIWICRLNKNKPDHRICYCTNKGLIYAIGLIGEYRGERTRKSSYKRGLDYLSKSLHVDGHRVSKSEIKRLVRPNCRKLHMLILPIRAKQIMEGIVNYIDYPENSIPHSRCKEMNHFCLAPKQVRAYCCYDYLIGDLIKQLDRISGNLKHGSFAATLSAELTGNRKMCR